MILDIVYQDETIVAINKPNGLLVHRSPIAKDAKQFALQLLRDQIGKHVYPLHRLDRKTSGVLLFCLDKDRVDEYFELFRERKVTKYYHALVRGHTLENARVDYALKTDKGRVQEAVTDYRTMERFEIDLPSGKFKTSRYSLLELQPLTGRMHQLRKHMAHIFHPIIGDRPHGCNKQNRIWKERWNMTDMLLHAHTLEYTDPFSDKQVSIQADYRKSFEFALRQLRGDIN